MWYLLIQHSLFTRKRNPFLLCTCNFGAGVANANHECKMLIYDEQIQIWEQSLKRWNLKRERDREYNFFQHMDFVDKKNKGVTHFGLHPNVLPRESIVFDVFHLQCAVTQRLMANL